MTDLSHFLRPGAIVAGLPAAGKKPLFQALAALAERVYGIDERRIVERLSERERLGSTGFGGGVAIPHGKVEGLEGVVGVFAQLAAPVDFAAVDDMPVDLVFMLVSPIDAGADHLKALAQVSRALRDRAFVAKLRGAASGDALTALLIASDARMQPDPVAPPVAHHRALESLYRTAPINHLFASALTINEAGSATIRFDVGEALYHAAGAVHGSAYFKMLDDAAFYAANSLVDDRFLLTTAFTLYFTRPLTRGPVAAEGRWVSGRRRVFVAEARLIDADGEDVARGTGTFMRSQIPLRSLAGYVA